MGEGCSRSGLGGAWVSGVQARWVGGWGVGVRAGRARTSHSLRTKNCMAAVVAVLLAAAAVHLLAAAAAVVATGMETAAVLLAAASVQLLAAAAVVTTGTATS